MMPGTSDATGIASGSGGAGPSGNSAKPGRPGILDVRPGGAARLGSTGGVNPGTSTLSGAVIDGVRSAISIWPGAGSSGGSTGDSGRPNAFSRGGSLPMMPVIRSTSRPAEPLSCTLVCPLSFLAVSRAFSLDAGRGSSEKRSAGAARRGVPASSAAF